MAKSRSEMIAGRAGSGNFSDTSTANRMLREQGRPGQFGGGGYQVLGGKGTAQRMAIDNALGTGMPRTAAGFISQQGGVPVGGGVGGGQAGGVGMPTGGSYGGVGAGSGAMGPGAGQTTMQTQQNPYLKQLMELSLGQFGKPLDREAELSKLRREQSQRMREAQQMGAAGGRGGLWGAQQQQLANEQGQTIAGTIAGFNDRETEARRALLGTMSGIAGEGVKDISSQLQEQSAALDRMERARQANMDYSAKMALLPYQAMQMKMQGLNSILNLL